MVGTACASCVCAGNFGSEGCCGVLGALRFGFGQFDLSAENTSKILAVGTITSAFTAVAESSILEANTWSGAISVK